MAEKGFGFLGTLLGVAAFWILIQWLSLGTAATAFVFFANPAVIVVGIIIVLAVLLLR